jgi:hypothetical protein
MLVSSIKSQIDDFLNCYTNSKVILTGGGAQETASALNVDVEIFENLVLDGIEYYVETSS